MRLSDPDAEVRERNESAWLLPNDGSRTNHQLRLDMRRFADSDAVRDRLKALGVEIHDKADGSTWELSDHADQ